MFAPVLILSLTLITWISPHGFVHGDEVEILGEDQATSVDSLSQSQRIEIIQNYFKSQGLSVDLDEHEYDQYELAIVSKMAKVIQDDKEFMENYRRVCEINSMIQASLARNQEADVAALQSLALIVPRSHSQVVFEAAKKDLNEFFVDWPGLALELVGWIAKDLDEGVFHTQDAMRFLEGSYHNWTPLGRLNKFIEERGEIQDTSRN